MKIVLNEKIKKYRKEKGLTQEQLAETMEVTVGTI
ncbi:MAG: helix-turn-helix domain-containing protein [Lachnospiraceae bacterium]|nr:helix-turn-helix domain-containing protein [Lachnospiraceae bacterium]